MAKRMMNTADLMSLQMEASSGGVQKQNLHALESFLIALNVFLGLFEPFPKS